MKIFQKKKTKAKRVSPDKLYSNEIAKRNWGLILKRYYKIVLLSFAFWAVCVMIIFVGKEPLSVSVGQVAQQDFVARVDFQYTPPSTKNLPGDSEGTTLPSSAPNVISYHKGAILITAGQEIGRNEIALLEAEQANFINSKPRQYFLKRLVGLAIAIAVGMLIFGFFIHFNQPRVFVTTMRYIALTLFIILMLVVSKSLIIFRQSPFLIPITFMAITIAIGYDRIFAIGVSLFTIFLIGLLAGNDFTLFVALTVAAVVAAFMTTKIRKRIKLVEIGLVAGVFQFLSIMGMSFIIQMQTDMAVINASFGFFNCFVMGLVVSGILPVIERVFKISTDISLLELSVLTQPLLKKLAIEAPGTYNHSLIVGSLAEAAAEEIGANEMLARIGSYFHDIGKLNKPDYFVENRPDGDSKHASLSASMSTLIITSHAKDGVEMAKEYKLPPAIKKIIQQHHGTTRVEYFYKSALEQAKNAQDAKEIDESSFRYAGPKPQSKEAAIVMLADAVESASRTLSEPTPSRIENLVNEIVNAKIDDSQLDDSDLSLREIYTIKRSFIKVLTGIYHSRIVYPE